MSEHNPTEYIVDFGDTRSNQFVRLNMALIKQNGAKLGERIVRCRDCKHMEVSYRFDTYRQEYSKVPEHYCRSSQFANWDWPIEVEPDGFCAWGERRASDD